VLVLSRKIGESILLGRDIEISLLDIQGGEIKLGISAPREVVILRKEIVQEIEESNRHSAKVVAPQMLGDLITRMKQDRKKT
jgi:carbon storage regulator